MSVEKHNGCANSKIGCFGKQSNSFFSLKKLKYFTPGNFTQIKASPLETPVLHPSEILRPKTKTPRNSIIFI